MTIEWLKLQTMYRDHYRLVLDEGVSRIEDPE